MTRTYNKTLTVTGPADQAARWLTDRGLFIERVDGSNGCDFKNETAEEYIVQVRNHEGFSSDEETYRLNHDLLTGYHKGDHEHYLGELRQELKAHIAHYVTEATGLHSVAVYARLGSGMNAVGAAIDSLVEGAAK